MKKITLLSICFSLISMATSHGMQRALFHTAKVPLRQTRFVSHAPTLPQHIQPDAFNHGGITIKRDRFGNLLPQWQSFREDYSPQLRGMVENLKDQYSGKAFIITLPVEQFHLAIGLKEAGFTLHYAKVDGSPNDRAEFIYKNGSPIPAPATAISGSKIFLRNNKGEVLFIHDQNPNLKNMLMIPGGGVDVQEFIENACVRELKEETGLTIRPENLKVVAIGNRVRVNPQGMSDTCWYFTADKFEGSLVPQQEEIKALLWALPSEVLLHGKYMELTPTLTTIEILKHLDNGANQSKKIEIPDLRQQLKPEEKRDLNDKMDLFLFDLSRDMSPSWKE